MDKLETKCISLNTIQMEFVQKTKVITAKPPREKEFHGVMYLKRPGKMRWDYKPPKDYYIISDGEKIWFYDKKGKQVMVGKLEAFLDKHLISSLFLNIKNVKKFFYIKGEEKKDCFKLTLSLHKTRPQLEKVLVWVTKNKFQIVKIQLTDLYGNINIISFTKIIPNPSLKNSLFDFQPPPGVEKIRLPY
jgi:chaperone LolA